MPVRFGKVELEHRKHEPGGFIGRVVRAMPVRQISGGELPADTVDDGCNGKRRRGLVELLAWHG